MGWNWMGMEWNGIEWNGMDWIGLDWEKNRKPKLKNNRKLKLEKHSKA
jgi:hypothetical protein